MTAKMSISDILSESDGELGRYSWEGSFGDYLHMVTEKPSLVRLSHKLLYEAALAGGVKISPQGDTVYGVFDGQIFGLEDSLTTLVQYFAAAAQRLEVRHRIMLLLGPPASGKSTVVSLIKDALEEYTRSDQGAVYAIAGCPMQEEPLHLIPDRLRKELQDSYGIYVEGDLCPRCRYLLRTDYEGRVSEMPVERVVFSEREAVGIGYYVATNPNPTDASLLVGSVDTSSLTGDRRDVAGRAFRLDGEMNVANRGLIEFVEMFKADRHQLTSLLGLAQEQVIKMEKFGSVYADEVILGHSNEGDFETFAGEATSEALRDRIIAFQIPYNLKVREEVKIYQKMMQTSTLQDVHIAPLTLDVASIFAVLSRLEAPSRQGMGLMEKLHLYDGEMVPGYTVQDRDEIRRHHLNEGMHGISPRYVMNRLGAAVSDSEVSCLLPLAALNSLWKGLGENVSLEQHAGLTAYVTLVNDAVREYNRLAIFDLQKAFDESFEEAANMLLSSYLGQVSAWVAREGKIESGGNSTERDMRELERSIGVTDRNKKEFRLDVHEYLQAWNKSGKEFDYMSEPRLRVAIETKLLPTRRVLQRGLTEPRFTRQKVEWKRRRNGIINRLTNKYGYCLLCAEDLLGFGNHILRNRAVHKTPKNEGIEWQWALEPPELIEENQEE